MVAPLLALCLATPLQAGCGDVPHLDAATGATSQHQWPATGSLPAACAVSGLALEVLFAPDDATVTAELSLIDRVRSARAADNSASLVEGKNPYRIRYAVYNLTHQGIIDRLLQAEDDGVDVQVLIEADQLDKPWSKTAKRFTQAGLEVVRDHRQLTSAARQTADLVGIKQVGLMHLKARLFITPKWRAALSGSMNPNQSAGINDETLHHITDPVLVARYAQAYQAVRDDQPLSNSWDSSAAVNLLFTPAAKGPRAGSQILTWLEQEQEQILLMVFSLRDLTAPGVKRSLVQILIDKQAQGVSVVVITDRKQSDGVDLDGNKVWSNDNTEDRLRQAGVPVYEALNDAAAFNNGAAMPYAAMHAKAAVLGRKRIRVITDAANWTYSGLGSSKALARNVESVLFIDSQQLDQNHTGRRYLTQWLRVLWRYGTQSVVRDGQPAVRKVARELTTAASWPGQPVRFVCTDCATAWGESIWAVGDTPALGRWGQAHGGATLTTSAADYPRWSGVQPARLPVGAAFAWKLVARGNGSVRWESGQNRVAYALPPVCGGASGETAVLGKWRP